MSDARKDDLIEGDEREGMTNERKTDIIREGAARVQEVWDSHAEELTRRRAAIEAARAIAENPHDYLILQSSLSACPGCFRDGEHWNVADRLMRDNPNLQ